MGRYRDRAEFARFGDDGGFLLIVLRVEDRCRNSAPAEPVVKILGFGDVVGADQDRLAGGVEFDDVVDDGVVLGRRGDVDPVGFISAAVGGVGRDR